MEKDIQKMKEIEIEIENDINNISNDTKEIHCSPVSRLFYHIIKLGRDLINYMMCK